MIDAPLTESPRVIAILRALEERITSLESTILARSAPAAQIQQGLHDILAIYSTTGQTSSVVSKQHTQIQALAEAMTIFHGRLIELDKRSVAEREDIHDLMIQLRSLARRQVGQLEDIERELGMTETAKTVLSIAAEEARAILITAAEEAQDVLATAVQDAQTKHATDAAAPDP